MTTLIKASCHLHRYTVTISVALAKNCTADDAEIDSSDVRNHEFEVTAATKPQAEELGLDQFHDNVVIGVLDYVNISAHAVRAA